ncbi:MAG: PLP-dependent aminotransferase family protein [Lachnospiraceae bacterium]|nr:PLP-dependent aminotransferase family protein [Lachnospiraceae bacterium]
MILAIPLDTEASAPLYEQIYSYIKNEIRNGGLHYKDRLPSARGLAQALQISRNTVDLAYDQLASEGYIESVPRSGYYVCRIGNLTHLNAERIVPARSVLSRDETYRYDFNPFAIDIANFPYSVWRKISRNCLSGENHELFLSGDWQGDRNFREAIAKYLHASRGVSCTADTIVIGAGTGYLLQLLAQLLRPREGIGRIAFENPTYIKAYRTFQRFGYEAKGIPVDAEGISLRELIASGASIAYVTPSHQYPLGTIMTVRRRTDLLAWAAEEPDRYIIEDDHDSEFRYKGKPIPSLQGMDSANRVIYLGTFSRAVTPAIRAGYMVLPPELLKRYRAEFAYSSTVSRFDQAILTEFITQGHFERHVNKMRTIYKAKHDCLQKALKRFGNDIRVTGEHAGLHLVVEFLKEPSEEELIEKAEKAGIRLFGLNAHYIEKPENSVPTLLIGFANLTEEEITSGIHRLYDLISAKE